MQGLVLQLTRIGFLLILWLFIWAVIRVIRQDVYALTGTRLSGGGRNRGAAKSRVKGTARFLVVTHGALANTRINLGTQAVLLGRAGDSTLVLADEYASDRHARLVPRGDDWYLEDLGSTNGTYLDRAKVTTAVRVPLNTPIRVGKTVIELRP